MRVYDLPKKGSGRNIIYGAFETKDLMFLITLVLTEFILIGLPVFMIGGLKISSIIFLGLLGIFTVLPFYVFGVKFNKKYEKKNFEVWIGKVKFKQRNTVFVSDLPNKIKIEDISKIAEKYRAREEGLDRRTKRENMKNEEK